VEPSVSCRCGDSLFGRRRTVGQLRRTRASATGRSCRRPRLGLPADAVIVPDDFGEVLDRVDFGMLCVAAVERAWVGCCGLAWISGVNRFVLVLALGAETGDDQRVHVASVAFWSLDGSRQRCTGVACSIV
jgi:hypothetical protein